MSRARALIMCSAFRPTYAPNIISGDAQLGEKHMFGGALLKGPAGQHDGVNCTLRSCYTNAMNTALGDLHQLLSAKRQNVYVSQATCPVKLPL